LVAGGVVLVLGIGAAVAYVNPFTASPKQSGAGAASTTTTALATVTSGVLSARTQVAATLGFAGSYTVVNQANGVVTALPRVGDVVRDGQVLYRVAGQPVVLLYGTVPAYRPLAEGDSGPDVRALNADLVALGYAKRANLAPTSDTFGYWTKVALKALQGHLGMTKTGTLALGQAVFQPTATRVTSVTATLGSAAQPGAPVLAATSTNRQVSIALDASLQAQVKVGYRVSITLPNGQTTPGRVSYVGSVATTPAGNGGGSSTPTIEVDVIPTNPAATGSLDQAPVQVAITTASVHDALSVPVTALLALAGGGYAVEVVDTAGVHRLVPVTSGLFDDAAGLVQVTGSGLSAGQHVEVPAS
jgi:hypothetical protein